MQMAKKHMQKVFKSLFNKKVKIKTIKHHSTAISTVKIQSTSNVTKDTEKLKHTMLVRV